MLKKIKTKIKMIKKTKTSTKGKVLENLVCKDPNVSLTKD